MQGPGNTITADFGGPVDQGGLFTPDVLAAQATGRNATPDLNARYVSGQISKQDYITALTTGTNGAGPVYDPSKGPQIDTGSGPHDFTPGQNNVGYNATPGTGFYDANILGNELTAIKARLTALQPPAGGPVDVSKISPTAPLPVSTTAPVATGTGTGTSILGTGTGSGSDANAVVAGAATSASAAKQAADKLNADLQTLLPQEGGQAAALSTEEASRGIPGMNTQLADINGQILTKTAEYNALMTDVQGKPITMNSIIGSQRQIINAKAADIGLLQAQAMALQGNIAAAEDAAKKAVDLKYSSILEQVTIKQAQLALLQPTLDAEEKKAAAAQQAAYDNQKALITSQASAEKDKNSTLLNLMQTYPDAKISLTDTLESANAKITQNSKIYQDKITTKGTTPTAADQKKTDISKTGAQLNARTGADHFVSPEDYATAKRAWVNSGYSSSEFDDTFAIYRNPKNNGYGLG